MLTADVETNFRGPEVVVEDGVLRKVEARVSTVLAQR